MNPSAQASSAEAARRARSVSGYVARRGSLAGRRRRSRGAARSRVKAYTKRPLTPEQRLRETPRRRSLGGRVAAAVAAVLGSAAAHLAILAIGVVTAALAVDTGASEVDRVTIQVREHQKPEPKPEPKPQEAEPIEAVPVQRAAPQKVEPEPSKEQPDEPPKSAPLRVVGISLESTVEGSGGPAFAVGSTRMGETAERAANPNDKEEPRAESAVSPDAQPTRPAAQSNRVASRIPTAKVEMRMPKRKRSLEPPYPATLKSQGVEADVTVMVTIDEAGRVTSVKLIAPSPYPEFNEAARATALAQEYEPALRDGTPVPYTLTYRYRFRVKD